MKAKHVTFTIPENIDILLHTKIEKGQMSKFVTQAIWDAFKKEDEALLQELLEADKDPGNREIKASFSDIEGEDFIGMHDFDFTEDETNESK